MSCGVACRGGWDPTLLWLWSRPVTTAPIQPLAWEPQYAMGAAQENVKKTKKKKKKKKECDVANHSLEWLLLTCLSFK